MERSRWRVKARGGRGVQGKLMAFVRASKPLRLLLLLLLCTAGLVVYVCLYRSADMRVQHAEDGSADNNRWTFIGSSLFYPPSTTREDLTLDLKEKTFLWKPHKVKEVDCAKLLTGNAEEFTHSEGTLPAPPTVEDIGKLAKNCSTFQQEYGFIMSSLTEEEENFPLAYSILVFKDAYQVVTLLQAIYRPQNVYCIHVDQKADPSYRDTMAAIADCFDNVFLTSRSVDVRWGRFTVLEPELICMKDLWPFKKWKYFINLTGQEFPLRTNFELVRILTAYNGANDLEGTVKRANKGRWASAGSPPHGIAPVKGSVHIVVNRDFVDYVLHSPVAQDFLNWTRRVDVPDETFFSSLNHNPHLGIRGSYKGPPETDPKVKPFLTRFKNWGGYPFDYPCKGGKRVRLVCILSTGDLPLLDKRPEMFANKFYQDYSRVALECLHERLYNHTRDEFLGMMEFNTSYYENLSYVKNTVTAEEANEKMNLTRNLTEISS
ncbi:beta-1,3-galactosyl-O-glycosyl-glycoprotein beta-1,6-N-acetylglucosaminyltransferase-like isoform X2 [Pomacea canaliculata]|uniref:beta-1,3-galactosyl-O-glycosyl-glycoprotein beta-1,6-N-acetylglucosaminyltransferase-like isoform X2 n=1 Tax=Pomacea canaliculata TaxID=400727 RepID=UPI000D725B28|nr:beta-1,3-galactosyl-O-glycosyl-glycoprotein beta-1,6-N-acetylglucosaminyltransferase-like isoform X2 [Pomacea canaliculata]